MNMQRLPLAGFLALAAFFYAWRLGAAELLETDECRSGVIVRDMVEEGRWLLPRTPDGYPTEKPILYYGLCALLALPLGVNEWTLRLVSGVMALGTLGLTWRLARFYGPSRAAAVAVVALMSNTLFLTWARTAMVDMTFTFFFTAGLTAYAA
jgi:4-amino-4-deoxy-L-arabinose transferase-like glycosyltransferase